MKLNKLMRPNLSDFRDHLLTKLSRPMAKKVLASFKGILSEAEARGHVVGNVANSVRIGNKGRHKEPVAIPTKAEVKTIMAKLDGWAKDKHWRRLRALFATAIYSGFRASELRGLPWDAVDPESGHHHGEATRRRTWRDRAAKDCRKSPHDQHLIVSRHDASAMEDRMHAGAARFR